MSARSRLSQTVTSLRCNGHALCTGMSSYHANRLIKAGYTLTHLLAHCYLADQTNLAQQELLKCVSYPDIVRYKIITAAHRGVNMSGVKQ